MGPWVRYEGSEGNVPKMLEGGPGGPRWGRGGGGRGRFRV